MATGVVLPIPNFPLNPQDPNSVIVWNNYFLSLANITGAVAPIDAQYYVATAEPSLTNERNLGALVTGFLFITVAAGIAVPSAVTSVPLSRGGTGTDLSATGGALQFLKQLTAGGAITVATISATDIAAALATLSSTYNPTLTNVANVAASTPFACQYVRVGNFVTVTGKVTIDPTAGATLTQLGISLPVASNFANAEECGGVAAAPAVAGYSAAIVADPANNRAELQFTTGADVASRDWWFSFGYQVI